jgi:hypothetical protein
MIRAGRGALVSANPFPPRRLLAPRTQPNVGCRLAQDIDLPSGLDAEIDSERFGIGWRGSQEGHLGKGRIEEEGDGSWSHGCG